jgi:DNA mismatch repair protein MutL
LTAGGGPGAAAAPELSGTVAAVEAAVRDFFAQPPRERDFFAAGERGVRQGPGVTDRGPIADQDLPGAAAAAVVPRAFQVLKSYLVVEAPDGLVLIDQHALHEKIIFEEVHRRLAAGAIASQRLVVPEVIDLPPEWMPLVEPAAPGLERLGFEIGPFGPRSVAVHAFPALFDRETGRTDLAAIVRGIFAGLAEAREEEPQPSRAGAAGSEEAPGAVKDEVRRIASLIACKRAVKAGTPLAEDEIRSLLARGSLAEDPRHCPHGRPTTAFLSHREIERRFDRK